MSSPDAWPDLAGRVVSDADGRRHVLPIRVYFEDTDFSGLVYHGSYVRWCERGRSDFLRLMGNDHQALIAGGAGREPAAFVVRRMHLEYLKPARIDEVLEEMDDEEDEIPVPEDLREQILKAQEAKPELRWDAVVIGIAEKQDEIEDDEDGR